MELETPQRRGLESERNVQRALEKLRDDGVIVGFRRTRRYSKADRQGVDFFIFVEGGRIPIQVKSSHAAMQAYRQITYKRVVSCVVGRGRGLMPALRALVRKYYERQNHAAAG